MASLEPVRLSVELPYAHAVAFAQFLKRAGHNDYRALVLVAFSDRATLAAPPFVPSVDLQILGPLPNA